MEKEYTRPDTGEAYRVMEPIGPACCDCREGIRQGSPYMSLEGALSKCSESEEFRQDCVNMSLTAAGHYQMPVQDDSVHTRNLFADSLKAIYDGHAAETCKELREFRGQDPTTLGIPSFTE